MLSLPTDEVLCKRLIELLHGILDNVLIGESHFSADFMCNRYSYLSNADYASIKSNERLICGGLAEKYLASVKSMGIVAQQLFLWHEPFVFDPEKAEWLRPSKFNPERKTGFNEQYMSCIAKKDFVGAEQVASDLVMEIQDRYKTIRHGHTLVEVLIGKERFVADPTIGILYVAGKEDLLRGKYFYESFRYLDQYKYLKTNIHRGLSTLFFSTPLFWRNIYCATYSGCELPSTGVE